MRKYELFEMGDRETVMDMYTRFTHITNELKSLGKPSLLKSWLGTFYGFYLGLGKLKSQPYKKLRT